MIARDIILAGHTLGHLHIAHVNTKGSVSLIQEAKKRKVNITCEAVPHYFTLTEDDIMDYNTNYKMNPPLRKKEDCYTIIEGLLDGTIDCISSEHAPHSREEKNVEFNNAPFGIIGLETELSLSYKKLVIENKMDIKSFIQKMTKNPSEIIRIDKRGSLTIGNFADIIIFVPKKKFVAKDNIYSKSQNTPFFDYELQGSVVTTIVIGKIVLLDEKFLV